MFDQIIAALADRQPITIGYQKSNGIVHLRTIWPTSIEQCQNGNSIVRAICDHQDAPRSFSVSRILAAF